MLQESDPHYNTSANSHAALPALPSPGTICTSDPNGIYAIPATTSTVVCRRLGYGSAATIPSYFSNGASVFWTNVLGSLATFPPRGTPYWLHGVSCPSVHTPLHQVGPVCVHTVLGCCG